MLIDPTNVMYFLSSYMPYASNRNALYKYSFSRHIKLLLLILIHLADTWYDDKYSYKVVISTIQTPAHDLKVKATDRIFMFKNIK